MKTPPSQTFFSVCARDRDRDAGFRRLDHASSSSLVTGPMIAFHLKFNKNTSLTLRSSFLSHSVR